MEGRINKDMVTIKNKYKNNANYNSIKAKYEGTNNYSIFNPIGISSIDNNKLLLSGTSESLKIPNLKFIESGHLYVSTNNSSNSDSNLKYLNSNLKLELPLELRIQTLTIPSGNLSSFKYMIKISDNNIGSNSLFYFEMDNTSISYNTLNNLPSSIPNGTIDILNHQIRYKVIIDLNGDIEINVKDLTNNNEKTISINLDITSINSLYLGCGFKSNGTVVVYNSSNITGTFNYNHPLPTSIIVGTSSSQLMGSQFNKSNLLSYKGSDFNFNNETYYEIDMKNFIPFKLVLTTKQSFVYDPLQYLRDLRIYKNINFTDSVFYSKIDLTSIKILNDLNQEQILAITGLNPLENTITETFTLDSNLDFTYKLQDGITNNYITYSGKLNILQTDNLYLYLNTTSDSFAEIASGYNIIESSHYQHPLPVSIPIGTSSSILAPNLKWNGTNALFYDSTLNNNNFSFIDNDLTQFLPMKLEVTSSYNWIYTPTQWKKYTTIMKNKTNFIKGFEIELTDTELKWGINEGSLTTVVNPGIILNSTTIIETFEIKVDKTLIYKIEDVSRNKSIIVTVSNPIDLTISGSTEMYLSLGVTSDGFAEIASYYNITKSEVLIQNSFLVNSSNSPLITNNSDLTANNHRYLIWDFNVLNLHNSNPNDYMGCSIIDKLINTNKTWFRIIPETTSGYSLSEGSLNELSFSLKTGTPSNYKLFFDCNNGRWFLFADGLLITKKNLNEFVLFATSLSSFRLKNKQFLLGSDIGVLTSNASINYTFSSSNSLDSYSNYNTLKSQTLLTNTTGNISFNDLGYNIEDVKTIVYWKLDFTDLFAATGTPFIYLTLNNYSNPSFANKFKLNYNGTTKLLSLIFTGYSISTNTLISSPITLFSLTIGGALTKFEFYYDYVTSQTALFLNNQAVAITGSIPPSIYFDNTVCIMPGIEYDTNGISSSTNFTIDLKTSITPSSFNVLTPVFNGTETDNFNTNTDRFKLFEYDFTGIVNFNLIDGFTIDSLIKKTSQLTTFTTFKSIITSLDLENKNGIHPQLKYNIVLTNLKIYFDTKGAAFFIYANNTFLTKHNLYDYASLASNYLNFLANTYTLSCKPLNYNGNEITTYYLSNATSIPSYSGYNVDSGSMPVPLNATTNFDTPILYNVEDGKTILYYKQTSGNLLLNGNTNTEFAFSVYPSSPNLAYFLLNYISSTKRLSFTTNGYDITTGLNGGVITLYDQVIVNPITLFEIYYNWSTRQTVVMINGIIVYNLILSTIYTNSLNVLRTRMLVKSSTNSTIQSNVQTMSVVSIPSGIVANSILDTIPSSLSSSTISKQVLSFTSSTFNISLANTQWVSIETGLTVPYSFDLVFKNFPLSNNRLNFGVKTSFTSNTLQYPTYISEAKNGKYFFLNFHECFISNVSSLTTQPPFSLSNSPLQTGNITVNVNRVSTTSLILTTNGKVFNLTVGASDLVYFNIEAASSDLVTYDIVYPNAWDATFITGPGLSSAVTSGSTDLLTKSTIPLTVNDQFYFSIEYTPIGVTTKGFYFGIINGISTVLFPEAVANTSFGIFDNFALQNISCAGTKTTIGSGITTVSIQSSVANTLTRRFEIALIKSLSGFLTLKYGVSIGGVLVDVGAMQVAVNSVLAIGNFHSISTTIIKNGIMHIPQQLHSITNGLGTVKDCKVNESVSTGSNNWITSYNYGMNEVNYGFDYKYTLSNTPSTGTSEMQFLHVQSGTGFTTIGWGFRYANGIMSITGVKNGTSTISSSYTLLTGEKVITSIWIFRIRVGTLVGGTFDNNLLLVVNINGVDRLTYSGTIGGLNLTASSAFTTNKTNNSYSHSSFTGTSQNLTFENIYLA